MNKEPKAGLITVFVDAEIKQAKQMLGIQWRSLILRGIKSATNKSQEEETQDKERIIRMATKIQELSTKVFNLEQK